MRALILILFFLQSCSSATKPESNANTEEAPLVVEEEIVQEKPVEEEFKEEVIESNYKTIEEQEAPVDNYYKKNLGPFFSVSAYVPYKVKIDIEEQIYKARAQIKSDQELQIKIISYYPVKNKKEKKLAWARGSNVVKYAGWKESVDNSHFIVSAKQTKDEKLYYTVDFEINIPKKKNTENSSTETNEKPIPMDEPKNISDDNKEETQAVLVEENTESQESNIITENSNKPEEYENELEEKKEEEEKKENEPDFLTEDNELPKEYEF